MPNTAMQEDIKPGTQTEHAHNGIATSLPGKGKYVDLTYLVNQTKGNITLIKKMVALYLKQTPELLDTIIHGTDTKDWVTVNTAVHKMIPSFWMMGIDPEMEVLARLIQENTGKLADLETLPVLCRKFEAGCMLACGELEVFMNTES